jgi:hypothetical protein
MSQLNQQQMPLDYCLGCRKAYASIIKTIAANNVVALAVAGIPIYYILSLGIYQASASIIYQYTSAVWVLMSIFIIAWIIAGLATWKVMPNLLSFSIFIYKAFGYWCLVSTFIVAFYISPYVPGVVLSYALWCLMPSILFLLVCGDILRAVRSRLYAMLENHLNGTPAETTVATTATTVTTGLAKPSIAVNTSPVNPFQSPV